MMASQTTQNRILKFLEKNFNAMPKWLKNITVLSIIVGIMYFGVFQKFFVYNNSYNNIEVLQDDVDKLNVKVNKMEVNQLVHTQMINEILTLKTLLSIQADFQMKVSEMQMREFKDKDQMKEYYELHKYDSIFRIKSQQIFDNNLKNKINDENNSE